MPGTLPDDSSHARFLFELKMQTQPTFNPPSSANVEESKSSPKLATRITGWTSNFLATAVVIVLALTVGRQLVFYWSDASTEPVASDLEADRLTASRQPVNFGVFVEGESGRRADVTFDNARVVRRK